MRLLCEWHARAGMIFLAVFVAAADTAAAEERVRRRDYTACLRRCDLAAQTAEGQPDEALFDKCFQRFCANLKPDRSIEVQSPWKDEKDEL